MNVDLLLTDVFDLIKNKESIASFESTYMRHIGKFPDFTINRKYLEAVPDAKASEDDEDSYDDNSYDDNSYDESYDSYDED